MGIIGNITKKKMIFLTHPNSLMYHF